MSVGADSLMAFVDVTKLFSKEILQKFSVKENLDNVNFQEQIKIQEVNHE